MDDMEHVSHALGWVVNVALEVHEGWSLLKDAVTVAVLACIDERLLVLVAFANEHVVADTNDIGHEGDHVGCLADRLAVCDLAHLLVKDLLLESKEVAGACEREACASGVVSEDGDSKAGVEDACALVVLPQVSECIGDCEDCVKLLVGLVPSPIEIVLVHVVDVQGFKMSCKFKCFAHFYSPKSTELPNPTSLTKPSFASSLLHQRMSFPVSS